MVLSRGVFCVSSLYYGDRGGGDGWTRLKRNYSLFERGYISLHQELCVRSRRKIGQISL